MGNVRELLMRERQQKKVSTEVKREMKKRQEAGLLDLKGSSDWGKERDGAAL